MSEQPERELALAVLADECEACGRPASTPSLGVPRKCRGLYRLSVVPDRPVLLCGLCSENRPVGDVKGDVLARRACGVADR